MAIIYHENKKRERYGVLCVPLPFFVLSNDAGFRGPLGKSKARVVVALL